jgi:20S proteasome alpha/beta subunit
MTLIVGIKCRDGVVVGADGAATNVVPLGPPTIRQSTKKIEILGDQVVLAVSGPVGLGQHFRDEIVALVGQAGKSPWKTLADAKRLLKERMWKHAGDAWARAKVVMDAAGASALQSTISHSLVAFLLSGGSSAHLIQFDPECSPEEATDSLPFVAAGSGQPMADPFLAFLRRILWPDTLPSVEEGVFAALWTLDYAIKAHPGGVAEPIHIVTLAQGPNKVWRAQEVPVPRLDEHRQALDAVEQQIGRAISETFTVAPTAPMPPKLA